MNSLIVGTWKLKSFEVQKENGETIYPFGQDATGLVIYSESGNFSVQYMPKEKAEGNLKGISYFGTFEYNREKDYIIHHVEGSLFPNTEGTDRFRYARIRGKSLTLTCPPLCWEEEQNTTVTIRFEKQEEMAELNFTKPWARSEN